MGEVIALGYVALTAGDLGAWRTFATDLLGMQDVSPSGADALQLRVDERAWRIAVEPGEDGGVAGIGFEVADRHALEALGARLEEAGVPVKASPELALARGVAGVLQATDPSGLPLEFFYGARVDLSPFVSPRGVRFVTGEQGLGHCVIVSGNGRDAYDFYVELLDFRLSDVIVIGGQVVGNFAHVNPRHHTLAFTGKDLLPPGFPDIPLGLQHVMVEVDDIDAVGRAWDLVQDLGIPYIQSLGRHANDGMVSFYALSPSGLAIEYGFGGRTIQEPWTAVQYDSGSIWGHRPPPGLGPTPG